MKKTIIIVSAFLVALSIVTASGQGTFSIGGAGLSFFAAPFASAQGSFIAIRAAPQVSTMKDTTQPQNNLQKQQQLLQTLSNISKTLNDTTHAIMRNIGG